MLKITQEQARNIWIQAQKLDQLQPFGKGVKAVEKAVEHLGYVQIDTIHVIERSHHHILFSRIPSYKKSDLHRSQSETKSVFEYWTHALSYVPTSHYRYFRPRMSRYKKNAGSWFGSVTSAEMQKVLRLIKTEGALSIRDIQDEVLVEKSHLWASKKPSKKALQLGFHRGDFVISKRQGMLKSYELTDRHFGWDERPKAVTSKEYIQFIVNRALKAQGFVSVDSICYLETNIKKEVLAHLQDLQNKKILIPLKIENCEKVAFWMLPEIYEDTLDEVSKQLHILSPFDPLIIQRKRLNMIFDYEHIFEAYVPPAKRRYGYFTLPILHENNIIAMLDLKTDREEQKLRVQSWHWRPRHKSSSNRQLIEESLDKFEKFQLEK